VQETGEGAAGEQSTSTERILYSTTLSFRQRSDLHCVLRPTSHSHDLHVCVSSVDSLRSPSCDSSTASSKNESSRQCDLVLSFSNSSKLSFPYGYPVAAYVFFLLFSSFPPFLQSSHSLRSVLRQVHSSIQSEFSMQCDIVLSLSICSNLSFP
jgi:hypothetical protein